MKLKLGDTVKPPAEHKANEAFVSRLPQYVFMRTWEELKCNSIALQMRALKTILHEA